jgi:hypothetical protein
MRIVLPTMHVQRTKCVLKQRKEKQGTGEGEKRSKNWDNRVAEPYGLGSLREKEVRIAPLATA